MLRRQDGHILGRALNFEVEGQKTTGRPKRTWKKQVEEESIKVSLSMEDTLCQSKWRVGIDLIATRLR